MKIWCLKIFLVILVFAIVITAVNISKSPFTRNPQSVSSQAENLSSMQAKKETQPTLEVEKTLIEKILVREEKLAYKDFVVEKRVRKVKDDFGSGSPLITVDVNYAVLKHKGKVVAKYDAGIYFGAGNGLSFSFFSFLGGEEKQLIVSQDIFREGKQWVVDLSSNKPKTIFDGSDFYVGREGSDLRIIDIDGDGVYEIMAMWTFFMAF